MDRSLYLTEKKGTEIVRDGPSLWVKEEGKAGWRIPARLIGRVVIIGNLRMDSGVITLFAEHNVPVTFMASAGLKTAVLMPYSDEGAGLHDLSEFFCRYKGYVRRFEQFIRSERRLTQLDVIRRISKEAFKEFSGQGFRDIDYRDFMRSEAAVVDDKWNAAKGTIDNLFKETIIAILVKERMDPHRGVHNRRLNFGLALDLLFAVEPEADLQTVQLLKGAAAKGFLHNNLEKWIVTAEGVKDIVHRFENRSRAVQSMVHRIIDGVFALQTALRS